MKRILSIILTMFLLLPAASFGAATLMPNPKVEFFNGSAPCSGCKVYTYESGTSTLKDTWTDSTKAEKNENPIKLNPRGEAAVGIWMDGVYSVKLTTSAGSVIWGPIAGVTGIADTTTFTEALNARSRWVESQAVPTYISATQFSALGDHTLTFPVERRVDIELGASHVYGRVTASSFGGTITTITILLDSGSITNAISKVYVSLESPTNPSLSFKMIDPASNLNSSGSNTFSGPQRITGDVNSSGTNTLSGPQNITGDMSATSIKRLGTAFFTSRAPGKSFTSAHASAAAVGGVVILDDPLTQLSSSGTLTTSVPIIWQGGAITKTASDKIYFGSSVSFGRSQVFIGFNATDINFGPGSAEFVPVEWWKTNAIPGTTVMTSALQSAINTQMPVKLLPGGRYLVDDTLTLSKNGFIDYAGPIIGSGEMGIADVLAGNTLRGSVIIVTPGFNKALFKLSASREFVMSDLTLYHPVPGISGSIGLHEASSNIGVHLSRVRIDGFETSILSGDGVTNGNDSESGYSHIWFSNAVYAYRSQNTQSFNQNFFDCIFDETTEYSMYSDVAPGVARGGVVHAFGCTFLSTNTIFYAPNYYGIIVAKGCHFESGTSAVRIVYDVAGYALSSRGVSITDSYFMYAPSLYNTSTPFIHLMGGSGPFTFTGNYIQHPNPILELAPSAGLFNFKNNTWYYKPVFKTASYSYIGAIRENEVYLNQNLLDSNNVETGITVASDRSIEMSFQDAVVSRGTTTPIAGQWSPGSKMLYIEPASGWYEGMVVTTPGTFGTLVGITGDITIGTDVLTVNTASHGLNTGDYITIAGAVDIGYGRPWFKVIQTRGTTIYLNGQSSATVVGAAIGYSTPVFKLFGAVL